MADKDPAKEKARKANIQVMKVALKKAMTKDSDGNPKWVGFAFSAGAAAADHVFMMSPRKKGAAVSKDLLKAAAKDNKGGGAPKICFGMATVGKSAGKAVIWLEYVKKLGGAERKMNEALKLMHLPFTVKPRDEADPGDAPPPAPPVAGEEDEDAREGDTEETGGEEADGADDFDFGGDHADDRNDEQEGDEEEGEDEEEDEGEEDAAQPAAPAAPQPASAPQAPATDAAAAQPAPAATPYKTGADTWSKVRSLMTANVAKFKAAVLKEYQDEPPALQAQISQALGKLDAMLEKFDNRLEQSLQKAHEAKDEAARKAELANSKKIIADYLKHMASEPLIAHLDKNPFGVDMNLKLVLTKSLTNLARTVS